MRAIIEGQHLWNHPHVWSGRVELVSNARCYTFPDSGGGPAGVTCTPSSIAPRVREQLANERRSGCLHLHGFGAITTGLGYEMHERAKAASIEEFVQGIADDELSLHRHELEWATELSELLGDTRPRWIHLDNEKFLNAGDIFEATKAHDAQLFWRLLRASRRAMAKIESKGSPLLADLVADVDPWKGGWDTQRYRDFLTLWSRYARRLCAEALSRLLHISGLTTPIGLMHPVRVTGYLYFDGARAAVDENGWPIATTTLDGTTSNYAFYGDSPKATALLLSAATHASGGPPCFVPTLNLIDSPTVNAHRLTALAGIGVRHAILYAPDGKPICGEHLNTLVELGAI